MLILKKIVRSNVDYTMYVIKETLKNKYKIYTIDSGTPGYKALRNMLISGQYDENLLDSIGIYDEKAKKYIKSELNILHTVANKFFQILNASIGQGNTDLTPLQMASYVSTLVNGGNKYKLHLIKRY